MSRLLLLALLGTLAPAAEAAWSLLAREDGCVDLQQLVRRERLARTPSSPEDFAQMLRARGESPSLGLPPGFPAELAGRVVQVSYAGKGPIFVSDEVCRNIEGGR